MNYKESFPKIRKINVEYFDCLAINEIDKILSKDKNLNIAILSNELKKLDFNKDYIFKLINQLNNAVDELNLLEKQIKLRIEDSSDKLCVFLKDKNFFNNSDLKNIVKNTSNGIYIFISDINKKFIINKNNKFISLNFNKIENFKKENIKLIKLDILDENQILSENFDINNVNKSIIIE